MLYIGLVQFLDENSSDTIKLIKTEPEDTDILDEDTTSLPGLENNLDDEKSNKTDKLSETSKIDIFAAIRKVIKEAEVLNAQKMLDQQNVVKLKTDSENHNDLEKVDGQSLNHVEMEVQTEETAPLETEKEASPFLTDSNTIPYDITGISVLHLANETTKSALTEELAMGKENIVEHKGMNIIIVSV